MQIDIQPRVDTARSIPPSRLSKVWPSQLGADPEIAAATLQQLIEDLPEQIALLSEDCTILAVNRAWSRAVAEHGYTTLEPGFNYRDFCADMAAQGYAPAGAAQVGLDDLLSKRRDSWELLYDGRDQWSPRHYQICFHRIQLGSQRMISVTRSDVTELLELRRERAQFGQSLMETQDTERRRFARELHDSTAQSLAAVGLLLGRLKHQYADDECRALVDELEGLVREAQKEIRSISYLAHPPALDELGLVNAVNCLVGGFGRRTGLLTTFDVHGGPARVSKAAEAALYRIVQEGLSNVHRHAQATKARVLLGFRRKMVHLIIADDGIGVSDRSLRELGLAGVGVASMRARLSELGGRLTVRKLRRGTAIIASIPAVSEATEEPAFQSPMASARGF